MKKLSPIVSMAAAVFAIAASAQQSANTGPNGNAGKDLKTWTSPVQTVDNGQPDGKCFSVTGSKMVTTQKLIELDPTKTYCLSGYFKSAGKNPNVVLVGLRLFNSDRKIIDASSVNAVSGSDTTLVEEAGAGSTTLKVRNAAAWEEALRVRRLLVAVGTDTSGEYKDLPNFQTYRVTDLQKDEDGWNVSLEKPLVKPLPAGTGVRAHLMSGHLMYAFTFNKLLTDWTRYQGDIKPMVKIGAPASTLWPGARYAQIMVLANWGQKNDETLLFRDIVLEEKK